MAVLGSGKLQLCFRFALNSLLDPAQPWKRYNVCLVEKIIFEFVQSQTLRFTTAFCFLFINYRIHTVGKSKI